MGRHANGSATERYQHPRWASAQYALSQLASSHPEEGAVSSRASLRPEVPWTDWYRAASDLRRGAPNPGHGWPHRGALNAGTVRRSSLTKQRPRAGSIPSVGR